MTPEWVLLTSKPADIFVYLVLSFYVERLFFIYTVKNNHYTIMKKNFAFYLLLILTLLLFTTPAVFAQTEKQAWFYCIDHSGKTVYYSSGKAVVKKGLTKTDNYQYGFMKWNGWINKSWQDLEYNIVFINKTNQQTVTSQRSKLVADYWLKKYELKNVPMPYPMQPFAGYKKDGTN